MRAVSPLFFSIGEQAILSYPCQLPHRRFAGKIEPAWRSGESNRCPLPAQRRRLPAAALARMLKGDPPYTTQPMRAGPYAAAPDIPALVRALQLIGDEPKAR